jgi:hypothetical protein
MTIKSVLHVLGIVLLLQLTGCASQYREPMPSGAIGAQLITHKGYPMVYGINAGSVAEQNGEPRLGDLILAAASPPAAPEQSLQGYSAVQAARIIRGQPGTPVRLRLQQQKGGEPREVVLIRGVQGYATAATLTGNPVDTQTAAASEAPTASPAAPAQAPAANTLVIANNSGTYLSPYTSDGVTAEWVNKAINAKMGSSVGSAVGAAAGAYAGRKALESVPGGSLLGSLFGGMAGSKAGKNVGRDAAIEASGGWDYIRQTSDLSFRSVDDMARWMTTVHGQKSNFQEVINATLQVYPELQPALVSAR